MRRNLLLLALSTALPLSAATFTVTNTADSGAGSLRQAILDANANAGADIIAFAIPGSGVHTISPPSALPVVTDPITIDGATQPGFAGTPIIELDGSGAGPGFVSAFEISAGSSTVRSLVINRFTLYAIFCHTNGNNVIEGNYLGTDPAGALDQGNFGGVALSGGSANNRIGGPTAAARNVISGNGAGLDIQGAGPGTVIQGNFIGSDASGTLAIPNNLGILATSPSVVIGGAASGEGNLISGNAGDGIQFQGGGAVIQGNLIGTDITGAVDLGNVGNGIQLFGTSGVTVGGTAAGAGNVISGNAANGILLSGGQGTALVQGNRIGTDAAGSTPLGNGGWGILIQNSSDNTVGGDAPGAGNVIAFNGFDGILVSFGTGNAIRGNAIFSNARLGIDLLPQSQTGGVTPNDPGDGDTGANELQNFPNLSAVTSLAPTGTGTRIQGFLHSTPGTTFTLDFYANDTCTPRPHDFLEGQSYLGAAPVVTDGSGDASFDVTLSVDILPGSPVSATATDPNGNTSELSQRLPFSIAPASGPAAGGTSVTISGTDFQTGAAVTIGGLTAGNVVVSDSATITATSPVLSAGTVNDLTVTNPDSSSGTLPRAWVADFLDVPSGHQFYSFVTTLVSNAITAGVGGGLYGVDASTLRQQMAVFLLKAKFGVCYTPPACTGVFPDVPCSLVFAPWIEALAANGITGGCGGGNYCPASPVRRDQMAVFLLKAKYGSGYLPPACTPPGVFPDVPCPGTFTDWIEELAAEMITGGCGGGNYCPSNPNTRGQMAVFIVKTFNLQ